MNNLGFLFLPALLALFSQVASVQQTDHGSSLQMEWRSRFARIHPSLRANAGPPHRYLEVPCDFESNLGQSDPQVRFLARSRNGTLFLTAREVVLSLAAQSVPTRAGKTKSADRAILRIQFPGSRHDATPEGLGELPGKKYYILGESAAESVTSVPTWAGVRYRGLYPGVEIVFRRNQGQLEFDAIVAPGTNPRVIRLRFDGAKRTTVSAQGDLVVETSGGDVRFSRPFVYQRVDGAQKPIAGRYRMRRNEVSFSLGPYDRSRPVVIDPTLSYGTYLGGSTSNGNDSANAVAVDAAGYIYLAGETGSADFPTVNAAHPQCPTSPHGACNEGFIAKLDAGGSRLVYSTYLTGFYSTGVAVNGIAVDSAGNTYATGRMWDSRVAFVMKLDSAGAPAWTQTFSGSPWAAGRGIAVDKSGYVYVTGDTLARSFGPIKNALQPTSGKDSCTIGRTGFPQEAFVAKFYPTGGLVYSTFLGGDGSDAGLAIAADDEGNAYVVGNTTSLNFPTVNPLQANMKGGSPTQPGNCNGGGDAFLAKISSNGSALLFSTYLGGSLDDLPFSIAIDGSGNILVSGQTFSWDFPVKRAMQPELHGTSDGFIAKVNAAGTELLFSTFVGGNNEDSAAGIAVDANGNAYVTGRTASPDFPSADAMQPFGGGGGDAFALKLNATGDTLLYGTWLGGSGSDSGQAIALDAANNVCVAGETNSGDFPTLNPFQSSFAGNIDVFAACIADPYAAKSVFSQFVDGQDTPSTLVLVNPSATRTVTGAAQLFDSNGQPLSVSINGSLQEGSFPFSVPPLGIGVYTTGGAGDTTVGSVRVSSDDSIGGTILFSGSMGVAGVGSAQMAARLVVPIESDVSRQIYTGVALANPYSSDLRLTLDLLDLHGNPIESANASVELPANGQMARFPEELFSASAVDFSRFRGTLRVQSPLSMSAMAIRLKPQQYATLPVTPIGGGSRKLQIAHLANGQGMVSTVILINPSPIDTAKGIASFISNDGGPLRLSVDGNPPSDTLAFAIPPLAAAFFGTDGSGSLTTGWTEISADRPIGGTILFSGPDGMAAVGATEPAASFLVPIESNAAANVFTGVAISNPTDSTVDLTLVLRDSNGIQVPDCVVQMILSSRAHVARFVEELFRDRPIDLSVFRGTLEIRATLPIGGMALRASPAEYATLPVTPAK